MYLKNVQNSNCHFSVLQDYTKAVQTLLDYDESSRKRIPDHSDGSPDVNLPSVFNFYVFLRSHPLVIRQKLLQEENLGISLNIDCETCNVTFIVVRKCICLNIFKIQFETNNGI